MTSRVRIALCQFGVRNSLSYKEMEDHLREQCEIALKHHPDIIVFPEYVTFNLFAMAGSKLTEKDRHHALVRYVAPFTAAYESTFSDLARRAGTVIAGGSHWTLDEKGDKGFNMAYLFRPDGRIETQKKNHLYPGEVDFGTVPSDGLSVFETPKARVGLMTCYDAEFPETARHLMLKGAQILLCPTATNTERGFYRVRRCCAARAVENQVYVVECHSVGSLTVPIDRPFTAYGRSAILSPIDDQTQVNNGIIVEAEDGVKEVVIVGEVDLDVLDRSRKSSEATILKDRRPQMYKKNYQLF
jgi:predicted amidohydrolase